MTKKTGVKILLHLRNTRREIRSSQIIRKEVDTTFTHFLRVIHQLKEDGFVFDTSPTPYKHNWFLTPRGKLIANELQNIDTLIKSDLLF